MGLAQPVQRLTEAEYLALERAAEFKSEFYDGEVFAMAGGSPMHSLIATNTARDIGNKLSGRPCFPYNSDLRVRPPGVPFYTYPDTSVVCGPLEFDNEQEDTITNPSLLVEVASPTTEGYDRGLKFKLYQKMRSLREYLVISQSEPTLDLFIRQDSDEWLLRSATGLDGSLVLPKLGVTLSLQEIYAGVAFPPPKLIDPSQPNRR
jgi:Uma2 family endonuclease